MFSLLTLLDDVASTLDDVAAMTKVAMGKTSALMSDDLAVNAAVVQGVNPDRELPMVKAIFLGSLLNKVWAIGGLFLLKFLYPPLIKVVLVFGGLYLSYEGVHKIVEKLGDLFKRKESKTSDSKQKVSVSEKEKIKGAVKTDLILSIEIIVIAQGAIKGPWTQQLLSLAAVGLGASLIIYGLVALLVKIDDLGLLLIKKDYKNLGLALVSSMPMTMKILGIAGTTAMLLVGGGIFQHTFHFPLLFKAQGGELLQNLALGLFAGLATLPLVGLLTRLKSKENSL